ncbi:hypothetical protein CEXT_410291 [Caerostris extrusa]|uniref:Uncharacterized protein n=1 Tax=Caerostris extrusa TaxID=172846 RepID=A0AAV4UMX4_CAEEX|nr:hypothetical protein CEXT_410291 [Caerostris extrusa]
MRGKESRVDSRCLVSPHVDGTHLSLEHQLQFRCPLFMKPILEKIARASRVLPLTEISSIKYSRKPLPQSKWLRIKFDDKVNCLYSV